MDRGQSVGIQVVTFGFDLPWRYRSWSWRYTEDRVWGIDRCFCLVCYFIFALLLSGADLII